MELKKIFEKILLDFKQPSTTSYLAQKLEVRKYVRIFEYKQKVFKLYFVRKIDENRLEKTISLKILHVRNSKLKKLGNIYGKICLIL